MVLVVNDGDRESVAGCSSSCFLMALLGGDFSFGMQAFERSKLTEEGVVEILGRRRSRAPASS